MKHLSNILTFVIFPGFVFLVHLVASKLFNLYEVFPQMDIPFHYMGGLSIACASGQLLSYLENEKMIPVLPAALFLTLILAVTATATVFWEFGEFLLDRWMHTNIQVSLANTMQDQFLGVLGGLTMMLKYWRGFLRSGI